MTLEAKDIEALYEEPISWARARRVRLADDYYALTPGLYREAAFTVSNLARIDQVQHVKNLLTEALENGESLNSWRKKVALGEVNIDLPRHHMNTIYRTNMQAAYSRGQYQRQASRADILPMLMYDAVNDNRTRPEHSALDGYIAPIDDPFWETHRPPNGFNCRCNTIQLSNSQARARGYNPDDAPPVGGPDKGWDYDPGRSFREGLRRSVERRKAACAVNFAPKNPGQPIWCSGPGALLLDRLVRVTDEGRRRVISAEERSAYVADFVRRAETDPSFNKKVFFDHFSRQADLADLIGDDRVIGVKHIILNGAGLRHAIQRHGPGGTNGDLNPFVPDDLSGLASLLNDPTTKITRGNRASFSGNPIVVFENEIEGVNHVAVMEVLSGKKNRGLALYSYYKN